MPLDIVAIARTLVLMLFPALAAAIRAGRAPRAAFDDAWAEHGARWKAEHGPDVAREAAATLDALGAADVLIKGHTAAWIARGPLAPLRGPVEAIPPPQPLRGIRGWRLWRRRRSAGVG